MQFNIFKVSTYVKLLLLSQTQLHFYCLHFFLVSLILVPLNWAASSCSFHEYIGTSRILFSVGGGKSWYSWSLGTVFLYQEGSNFINSWVIWRSCYPAHAIKSFFYNKHRNLWPVSCLPVFANAIICFCSVRDCFLRACHNLCMSLSWLVASGQSVLDWKKLMGKVVSSVLANVTWIR